MMSLYATGVTSLYLLIACLTSVNGYIGTIYNSENECISLPGRAVPNINIPLSVVYSNCKLTLLINMTYGMEINLEGTAETVPHFGRLMIQVLGKSV